MRAPEFPRHRHRGLQVATGPRLAGHGGRPIQHTANIKVFLSSDRRLFADCLSHHFATAAPQFELVADPADGAGSPYPVVCVRDVGRADLGGNARAHIVDELRRTAPAARILIVSSRKNAQDARGWIVAGAHGYLPAHSTPDLLTAAAVVVAAGGVFLPEELARSLSYPDA